MIVRSSRVWKRYHYAIPKKLECFNQLMNSNIFNNQNDERNDCDENQYCNNCENSEEDEYRVR